MYSMEVQRKGHEGGAVLESMRIFSHTAMVTRAKQVGTSEADVEHIVFVLAALGPGS